MTFASLSIALGSRWTPLVLVYLEDAPGPPTPASWKWSGEAPSGPEKGSSGSEPSGTFGGTPGLPEGSSGPSGGTFLRVPPKGLRVPSEGLRSGLLEGSSDPFGGSSFGSLCTLAYAVGPVGRPYDN